MEYISSLVDEYRNRGVLVDTSLLLVLYIGLHDPEQVEKFPRTRRIGGAREVFTRRDYEAIRDFIDQFSVVVTTPYILSEVSNFLGQARDTVRDGSRAALAQHLASATTIEHAPSAERLTSRPDFVSLGLTDTSIIEVAAKPYLVFTTDYPLAGRLNHRGMAAINYNNYRPTILGL